MSSHPLPVLSQDAEESADLRARFNHICDGSIVGLVGASVTGRLAEDGGLADLRMANLLWWAVNGDKRQDAGGRLR